MATKEKSDPSSYLEQGSGVASWLVTRDHKRVAVLYLVGTLVALLVGGGLAVVLQLEHMAVGATIFDEAIYQNLSVVRGLALMLVCLVPAIPGALGSFLLPLMLGARNLAFPRLNLASFYLWLVGAVLVLAMPLVGGIDGPWALDSLARATDGGGVDPVSLMAVGLMLLSLSSLAIGANLIATVHELRPKGVAWLDLPLFGWSLYGASVIHVFATPILTLAAILLVLERMLGVGLIDVAQGADPNLFHHLVRFYAYPATFGMVLPAMGVVSELIGTFSRRRVASHGAVAVSCVAIAVFAFVGWGQELTTVGLSDGASVIFSALAMLVLVPFAVVVFSWLGTLASGALWLRSPMIYALGALSLFALGGLTGLAVRPLSLRMLLAGTTFEAAHVQFLVGATVLALLGGLYHWWPKMFGVMPDELLGRTSAGLTFVGLLVAFVPQVVMGIQGMPEGAFDIDLGLVGWQQAAGAGAVVAAVGVVLALAGLFKALGGDPAPANPWGGSTFEWHTSSPPPVHNFDERPDATDLDFRGWTYDEQAEGFVREPAQEGA